MVRTFLFVGALFASSFLVAEVPDNKPQASESKIPARPLPIDQKKLAAAIDDSFYHPDQLSAVKCAAVFDWSSFFTALKVKVPEERMHSIDGLQIHFTAVRGKRPDVKFNWVDGRPEGADQLEDGIQKIISGFYQMYWPLMAVNLVPDSSQLQRIEPQIDGTVKLFESDANNKVEIDLNKDSLPAHWAFESPGVNGTFDFEFADSPQKIPGDLRRISNLRVITHTGTNTMNVQIKLDYQSIDGFNIPQHIAYDIGGAYSIAVEFIGCSASKDPDAISTHPQ